MGKHAVLIERMRSVGYEAPTLGVCHGLFWMAAKFLQEGKAQAFNELIAKICSYSNAEIYAMVNTPQSPNPETQTEYAQLRVKVMAFLDGITAFQTNSLERKRWLQTPDMQDEQYPLLSNHHPAIPEALQFDSHATLGTLIGAQNWVHLYHVSELSSYFKAIKHSAVMMQLPAPLIFYLCSSHHALGFAYDPASAQWFFLDANHDPMIALVESGDVSVMVEKIQVGFRLYSDQYFFLGTQILTSPMHQASVNLFMKRLEIDFQWMLIHAITLEKFSEKINDLSWPDLYIRYPRFIRYKKIQRNLLTGLSPEMRDDLSCYLHDAIIMRNSEAVLTMIKMGANVNHIHPSMSLAPLGVALLDGNFHAISMLLAAGADVIHAFAYLAYAVFNTVGSHKIYEILGVLSYFGIYCPQLVAGLASRACHDTEGGINAFSSLKILHDFGVDMNHRYDNHPPIYYAAIHQHLGTVKWLLQAGVSLESLAVEGVYTPLQLEWLAYLQTARPRYSMPQPVFTFFVPSNLEKAIIALENVIFNNANLSTLEPYRFLFCHSPLTYFYEAVHASLNVYFNDSAYIGNENTIGIRGGAC